MTSVTQVTFSLLLLLILQVVAGGISEKKGLCIPPKGSGFHCGDLEAFSRVSWWYNWGDKPNHDDGRCTCPETNDDCGPEPDMPAFVPMIWGWPHKLKSKHNGSDPIKDKYPYILGFNEPNNHNLSPQIAAEAWIEIQTMYPDKILVSPSPNGNNAIPWFDEFFQICDLLGCRIDYLAYHEYSGNTVHLMTKLEELYDRYGRKIWLTEFAKCCTRNVAKVEEFAMSIIPLLEEAEFVYRYSWFITRYDDESDWYMESEDSDWYLDKVNALFLPGSMELSSLGHIYNNL